MKEAEEYLKSAGLPNTVYYKGEYGLISGGIDLLRLITDYLASQLAKKLPRDLEIILESSGKVYVNDEQRIGFQKGAKWIINQLKK